MGLSIIDAWRTAIKRRDVNTEPGARYGDPRRGLLEGAAWTSSQPLVCRALNRSLDAALEIDGLTRVLDTAYREVSARIDTNPDLRRASKKSMASRKSSSRRSINWKSRMA